MQRPVCRAACVAPAAERINKKKYFMDRMKEIIDKDNEEDE